jgi:magnesium-dependent phosphatase 1
MRVRAAVSYGIDKGRRTTHRHRPVSVSTLKANRSPTMELEKRLPKLVAFDLDATLWEPEMYLLSGPPFKVDPQNDQYLVDGSGERIELMGYSRQILLELATDERWRGTTVAYVSRTDCIAWAKACLKLFKISPGLVMHDVALEKEIYPGCKCTHFQRLYERTGIKYEEMLFFDNERWNITDVAPMGVCSIYTPRGMTKEAWHSGLQAFSEASKARGKGLKPQLAVMRF